MDLVNSLSDRLLFAVPKKGRLHQPTLDLLHGSDIQFHRHSRLDIALCLNLPIALVFLPAADIPTFVGEGKVDLGITGADQVAEHDAREAEARGEVVKVQDLEFGGCKLQVQAPVKGAYRKPQDLIGKTVVTSFTNVASEYFRKLESAQDESTAGSSTATPAVLRTRIKFLSGSVEAACALGVADGIVDLVESGETMRVAGLEAIDTVMASTAILIRSQKVSNQALVDLIASRIRGVISAQRYVLCQYNVHRNKLEIAKKTTPGQRAPTITSLDDEGWVAVSSMVEKKKIALTMDELERTGATDILVLEISNTRTS